MPLHLLKGVGRRDALPLLYRVTCVVPFWVICSSPALDGG